jgi:hypothetical protein
MGKVRGVYALCMTLGAMLAMASMALAAGDANEAQCSAETEASPGFRQYLPDCRAYELVTPPYKEGGIVLDEPGAVSANGSRVIVGAGGAFSGAGNFWYNPERNSDAIAYELERGADGWQSSPLAPPADEYSHSALMAVSAENFETTLWGAEKTVSPGEKPALRFHEDIYLRTGPAASEFKLIGPGTPLDKNENIGIVSHELDLVGASRDLSHSLFQIRSAIEPGGHSDLWDGDTTKVGGEGEQERLSLYEYVYTGTADSEPVLLGVKNEGPLKGADHINEGAELISDCGTELGSRLINPVEDTAGSVYNAVSSSGEVVFFTSFACEGGPEVNELYARVNGERTLAISEPVLPGGPAGECGSSEPCHGAGMQAGVFEGASEAGRRVFFLSEQPLVNGAPAEGMKLYEERLEGATVVQIVDLSNLGIAARIDPEVQGVVHVSEDGERVYFIAKGKLTGSDRVTGREPEDAEPVQGADNLYLYESEPGHPGAYHTVFVATMLTPGEEATLAGEEAEEEEGIRAQAKKTFAYELEPAEHALERAEHEFELPKHEFESAENEFESAKAEISSKLEKGEITNERALELLAKAQETFAKAQETFAKAQETFAKAQETFVGAEKVATETKRAFVKDTVGTLGPSGTLREDQSVWQDEDNRPAQANPSGNVLAFLSSAKLTPGDTSSVPQLFVYDADDASLTRDSVGQTGPASGNVDTFQGAAHIPGTLFNEADLPTAANMDHVLTEEGSQIFFTSAANLAPEAENKATNVYENSGGNVYLISGGSDASKVNGSPAVTLLGTDTSGQDAFFLSEAKLVPQYGDTQVALYDAREEGGFPAPVLEPGCFGEACRGPSGSAPPYRSPGSVSQTGGGNLSPATSRPEAAGPGTTTRARRLAKALRACRAKRARKRRAACEARARGKYGKGPRASRAQKSGRTTKAKREGER